MDPNRDIAISNSAQVSHVDSGSSSDSSDLYDQGQCSTSAAKAGLDEIIATLRQDHGPIVERRTFAKTKQRMVSSEVSSEVSSQDQESDGCPPNQDTGRLRWTPSPNQLQILNKFYDQGKGIYLHRAHVREEIMASLSLHGPTTETLTETNVISWFDNKRCEEKIKQWMRSATARLQDISSKDRESDTCSPNQEGHPATSERPLRLLQRARKRESEYVERSGACPPNQESHSATSKRARKRESEHVEQSGACPPNQESHSATSKRARKRESEHVEQSGACPPNQESHPATSERPRKRESEHVEQSGACPPNQESHPATSERPRKRKSEHVEQLQKLGRRLCLKALKVLRDESGEASK